MSQKDEVIANEFKALTPAGKVRFLMELQGFDTTEMAKLMGISRQTLSALLNRREWTVKRIKQAAEILAVPPAILL